MDEEWCRQVDRRLHALEMRNAVDEVHRLAVEKRLGSIEDMLKWLVRLVFGALLTALITYVLKGGFLAI